MGRADWMNELPEQLRTIPFNRILLPGSHNSASYKVNLGVRFEDAKANWAGRFSWVPGVKKICTNWTQNQDQTIYNQLVSGIRKLDFRVSYSEGKFYFSHTFALIRVETGLQQIREFLCQHRGEVIYIDCKPDHANKHTMTFERGNEFLEIVKRKLGHWLIPNTDNNRITRVMTLDNLKITNQRVLFNYFGYCHYQSDIWKMTTYLLTEYTDDVNRKWEIINEYMSRVKNRNDGQKHRELALTLTPRTGTVVKSIYYPCGINSTQDLTDIFMETVYNRLLDLDISKINSLNVDFPDPQFINWVIQYNLDYR